jgi:hypothetical protein
MEIALVVGEVVKLLAYQEIHMIIVKYLKMTTGPVFMVNQLCHITQASFTAALLFFTTKFSSFKHCARTVSV